MTTNTSKLRLELRRIISTSRREAAIFAFLTVILTPVFIALAVFVFLFLLGFADLPIIDQVGQKQSFVSGVNLCLIFMFASNFLRPADANLQSKRDWIWIAVGLIFLFAILLLSYVTPFAETQPLFFWSVYILLALLVLGCFGYAYEPKESYYLGWVAGPLVIDNFFTVKDDIDRARLSLGFAVAIPNLIISSYSEIFGSTWLWRGLKEQELSGAVKLLQVLAMKDTKEAKAHMRTMGERSALRVVRALAKLGMITIERRGLKLTTKGQDLLGMKTYY